MCSKNNVQYVYKSWPKKLFYHVIINIAYNVWNNGLKHQLDALIVGNKLLIMCIMEGRRLLRRRSLCISLGINRYWIGLVIDVIILRKEILYWYVIDVRLMLVIFSVIRCWMEFSLREIGTVTTAEVDCVITYHYLLHYTYITLLITYWLY